MINPLIQAVKNREEYIKNTKAEELLRREQYRKKYDVHTNIKIQEICKKISESTENVIKIAELSSVELVKRARAISTTSIWDIYEPFHCCLIEKLETFGVKVCHNPNINHTPSLVIYVDQIKCS